MVTGSDYLFFKLAQSRGINYNDFKGKIDNLIGVISLDWKWLKPLIYKDL